MKKPPAKKAARPRDGEPLGLETARDLIREVEHAYPELAAEWIENE
jgi:hypothetical protein